MTVGANTCDRLMINNQFCLLIEKLRFNRNSRYSLKKRAEERERAELFGEEEEQQDDKDLTGIDESTVIVDC